MKKHILLFLFLILAGTSAFPQFLTENFDYGATGNPDITAVTTNWVRHSGAVGPVYQATSLTYAGYYGSNVGGSVQFTKGGSGVTDGDVSRKFSDSVSIQSNIYASFLMRIDTARATSDYFFHLGPYTMGTTFRGRVYVKANGAGFSMSLSKTGTPIVDDATVLNLGQTYLVVLKYTFNIATTTDDVVSLYVYDSGLPVGEPGTPVVTIANVGDAVADGVASIGTVAIRQGTNTPYGVVDGIMISRQWETFLPVELTSFNASASGNNVNLTWTTATEKNNRGFEVERKSADGEFASCAFINGAGTTIESRSYTYTDTKLSEGKYTYRLKQIDLDGSFTYSKAVEVDVTAPVQFELGQNYPNPFNPSTVISYQIPVSGMVTLKVYDMLGNEAASLVNSEMPAGKHNVSFNAADLSSGVYYYTLSTPGFTATKKLTLIK